MTPVATGFIRLCLFKITNGFIRLCLFKITPNLWKIIDFIFQNQFKTFMFKIVKFKFQCIRQENSRTMRLNIQL